MYTHMCCRAKTQLDTIKQCEMQINEAESCIRYMAIESIAEIRQNERALLKVSVVKLNL